MKIRHTIRMLAFGLMLLGAASAHAQNGSISGTVRDAQTQAPLADVNITLERDGAVVAGTTTDTQGRYRLAGVPPGTYRLIARFIGYDAAPVFVALGTAPMTLDVAMEQVVFGLDGLEVTASLFQEASDVNVSLARVTARQVRQLPGGAEDLMRALQTLPGVQAASDYSNQVFIRGGTPDQNLILLDDIEVFSPYQLNGMGSLLNPALIRRMDLYAGAFPAGYGDRLSSVLAVETRDGRADTRLGGRISSNMLNVNLTLEGKTGFLDGSWIASGRRTYFDSFANTFARRIGIFNDIAFPDFVDGQFKMTLHPGRGHHLRFTALRSRDQLDWVVEEDALGQQRDSESLIDGGIDTYNTAFGLTWTYLPNPDAQVKVFANWYRNNGDSDLSGGLQPRMGGLSPIVINPPPPVFAGPDTARFVYRQHYALEKATLGGRFLLKQGRHSLEAGAGFDRLDNGLDLDFEANEFGATVFDAFVLADPLVGALAQRIDENKTYHRVHAYVQDKLALGAVFIQPSLRYDYYGITGNGYLSPRLSLSVALDAVTALRVAGGRFVQSPGFEKLLDQDNVFNLARFTGLDSLEAEEALHLGASISRQFGQRWNVRVEGYWKKLDNLITQASRVVRRPVANYSPAASTMSGRPSQLTPDAYIVLEDDVLALTPVPVNEGSGEAYGVEVLIEKRRIRASDVWSGWFSYAQANATREQDVMGQHISFPFDYDRRHTVNLTVNRRLGRHVNVGLAWRYGSGFPYTPAVDTEPLVGIVQNPNPPNNTQGIVLVDPETGFARLVPSFGNAANINAGRLPDYHRLDVRATYLVRWREVGVELYVDLINVYNRRNTVTNQYFVDIAESPRPDLPIALRPPATPILLREPVYMFPFIPSFGLSLAF